MSKSVGIFYHYVARYRQHLFLDLMNSKKLEVSVYAGLRTEIEIEVVNELDELGIVRIRNVWVGLFLFQPYAVIHAFTTKQDVVVFLGVMYYPTTWLAALILKLRGKRVVFWGHGQLKIEQGIKGWLRRTFLRLPDVNLVYNHRSAKIVKSSSGSEVKVFYNSLPIQILSQEDAEELVQLRQSKFTVGFIGRLTPQKSLDKLMMAVKKIRNDNRIVEIEFVGDGGLYKELQSLAFNLDLPTKFHGAIYDPERTNEIMSGWTCVVSPGNVGLTAIHALSRGIPVITHNDFDSQMPEVEAIREGETGFFFKKNDIQSLAQALERASDRYGIGVFNNCINEVQAKWNSHNQVRIMEELVEELVSL